MAKTYIAGEGAFKNIKTAEDLNKNGFISTPCRALHSRSIKQIPWLL